MRSTARPIVSVGIDIGSATSQVVISRLWLDQDAQSLVSSTVEVREREVLHASPIWFTPFRDDGVDGVALRARVEQAYAAALIVPADVHTGALIVTGEASRQHNATAIAAALSDLAGSFVCVAAGPHLEARLAAFGSGAVARSAEEPAATILHVDIGGATTKLSVIRAGEIMETAATNVGGRMLSYGEDGVTASAALQRLAHSEGIDLGRPDRATRVRLATAMARHLLDFIHGKSGPLDEIRDDPVTEPLRYDGPFDLISYSGGVAAYLYGEQADGFGDLGPELASAIVDALTELNARTLAVNDVIRATVLGASQFGTQVSGATTHRAVSVALPLRGLRAVPIRVPEGAVDWAEIAALVRDGFAAIDLVPGEQSTAVSFQWHGEPSFARLSALVDGLFEATGGAPTAVTVDRDLAGAIGALLEKRAPRSPVVVVDEVRFGEFDVIDIGRPVSDPPVLPIVVRTVVIGATVSSTH